MRQRMTGWLLASAVALAGAAGSPAQPPAAPPPGGELFRPPQKASEFWAALNYEISIGKYDLAAGYLKGFLAANPTPQDFLQIEEQRGFNAFLSLRNVPRWSDKADEDKSAKADVEELIKRATEVIRAERTNPERIAKLARNLSGTPEEQVFALRELRRAGAAAIPPIVDLLRTTEDAAERVAVLRALPKLGDETVPPLLAALDLNDAARRLELMGAVGARGNFLSLPSRSETDPTPTLFHFLGSLPEGDLVRREAVTQLTRLLARDPSRLPLPKEALTQAADQFYRHNARFGTPSAVTLWTWTGQGLVSVPANASQAEEYYGLRYAHWALELDPAYEPAQVLFMSLAVEKAIERGGPATPLAQAPGVYEPVAAATTTTLANALDRALSEGRAATALGLVQVLRDRGQRSAAGSQGPKPGVLVKALDFPDRRVQVTAAEALVFLPGPPNHQASARVVDVLRRAVAAEPEPAPESPPKALLGDFNTDRAAANLQQLRRAGFDARLVRTGRELIRRLNQAADIDVIVLDSRLPYPGLAEVLGETRTDVHFGRLPVFVTIDPALSAAATFDEERRLAHLAEGDKRVHVVRGGVSAAYLDRELPRPGSTVAAPLTEAERKALALRAIAALALAADKPGYDIFPAEAAIRQALRFDDLAPAAIHAAGRLPSKEAQQDLANVVLGGNRKPEVRVEAAAELARHAARFGAVLAPAQVQGLRALADAAGTPVPLREVVSAALGAVGTPPAQGGGLLLRYTPPLPAAGPPPAQPPKPAGEPEKEGK